MDIVRVKVNYGDKKFYFSIPDPQVTFDQLKVKLVEQINTMGSTLSPDLVGCQDAEGYFYLGSDKVAGILKDDSVLFVKELPEEQQKLIQKQIDQSDFVVLGQNEQSQEQKLDQDL